VVSSRLSALQQELVDAFFSEPSAFFLTGGAALAGYYIGHRFTDDLDLFSPPVESMELAVQRLRRAASAIGGTVEAIQDAPDFRRFAVQRAADVTLVDLVIDRAPQLVVDKVVFGAVRIDPEREIAANKITALLGRTAPRDLVDLFALFDRGHTLEAALADARTKDAAADPATLAWVLSQWRLGPSVPLPLGVTLEDVERMRGQLIERLLVLAVPREP
jgi:predicted nucleotidyltransferase component of viral defense system